MAKKIYSILIVFSLLAAGIFSSFVLAKNDKGEEIPDVAGIYDVPGRPDMKVRVFVRPVKPNPQPTPHLVCGLPDDDSEAVVDKTEWHLPAEWEYSLNVGSVPLLVGSKNLSMMAANAFSEWNSEIPGKVNIIQDSNTIINKKALDGKNIISWGSAPASALAVTYVWYYQSTGQVAEVDTIMNKKFVWTWSGGTSTCAYTDSYDAQSILTHELGHWFGLDDEYTQEYVNNTMYGYGFKMDAKGNTLTTGDIEGLKEIYY